MTRLLLLLACAAALLAGCGNGAGPAKSGSTRAGSSGASRGLPELTNVRELRTAFDAHPGVPRLLILLSPT
jgi:ABC-type glycerol-3-phosphate transport system substrate-binding protein